MRENPTRFIAVAWFLVLFGCGSTEEQASTHLGAAVQAVTSTVAAEVSLQSDWGSGYVANVVVHNNGTVGITSWSVDLDLQGSSISGSPWRAVVSGSSGSVVTFVNETYDGAIPPGGSEAFGFVGVVLSEPHVPTVVAVNTDVPEPTTPCDVTLPDGTCVDLPEELVIRIPTDSVTGSLALSADSTLRIADGVVVDGDNAKVTISNTGTAATQIGVGAELNADVLAGGPVDVFGRASISGRLQTAGTANISGFATIEGGVASNTPLSTEETEYSVRFPEPQGDVVLPPDTELDLAEGSYGSLVVYSRSILRLTGSVYYSNSVQLEPDSLLDSSGDQPVLLFVRGALTATRMDPSSLDPEKFLVVVVGNSPVSIQAPWSGTIVAPNAPITFFPLNDTGVLRGSFFGKSLNVDAHNVVEHVPFGAWSEVDDLVDPESEPPPEPVGLPTTNGPPPELSCLEPTSTVSAFLSWAQMATTADLPAARAALENVTCPATIAQSLIGIFVSYRNSHVQLAREALIALGALRSDEGLGFFFALLNTPLPTSGTVIDGVIVERKIEEGYRLWAVRGLGYRGSATGDALLRHVVANHESRGIRGEAIRVYLYGMPASTRQHLETIIQPGDEVLLDRFENGNRIPRDMTFDEQMDAFRAKYPQPQAQ